MYDAGCLMYDARRGLRTILQSDGIGRKPPDRYVGGYCSATNFHLEGITVTDLSGFSEHASVTILWCQRNVSVKEIPGSARWALQCSRDRLVFNFTVDHVREENPSAVP